MASAARGVAVGALVVALAAGGYATADAYDMVPGRLTLAAPLTPAKPFPTATPAQALPEPADLLAPLDGAAPMPDPSRVQGLVDALVADPRVGTGAGVVVTDALTGGVLAQSAADAPHVPASTAKLVTATAALTQLPLDSTVPTRVVRGTGDQLVLVGGGDMMLAAGQGDPTAVVGHAGIGDLADQVSKALTLSGRTSVSLAVDDTLFSGPALSPTWDPADIRDGYVAPVAAVAVDVAKMREGEYPPRYPDPAMNAAEQLGRELASRGITVVGAPTRATARADAEQVAVVQSAPLSEIVEYFLHSSDNTITEVVARLVAVHQGLPGSFDAASQAVLRAVAALGVDTTGAQLVDASGLGAGSALSPAMLASLVRVTVDPAHPQLRTVATGMPVAGLSGTLTHRYVDSPARGLVRAKTGSLPNVTALAGTVVDADGRMLVFAVVADQTPGGRPGRGSRSTPSSRPCRAAAAADARAAHAPHASRAPAAGGAGRSSRSPVGTVGTWTT